MRGDKPEGGERPNIFRERAEKLKRERAAAEKRRRSNGANGAAEPEPEEPPPAEDEKAAPVTDINEARRKRHKAPPDIEYPDDADDPTSDYHRLRATLSRNDNGGVYGTHANMLKILRGDPALVGLVVRDRFALRDSLTRAPPEVGRGAALAGPYPRLFTEADATLMLAYMQEKWSRSFRLRQLQECLATESERQGCHPVLDWLKTLKWDGRQRLDFWLDEVFAAGTGPYQRAVASKLLIAAVRRVREPGCKFDYLVVLEGAQGILKSTAVATLWSVPWFTDQLSDISKKDAAIDLRGKWVVELAEIERIIRADVEHVKAFLSRGTDHYRPPYARDAIDVPRQCVLVGTTNDDTYLRDVTGNRRIWPIKCLGLGAANIQWLRDNREQLWAEAAEREALGEQIYMARDAPELRAAEEEQDKRLIEEPWADQVLNFVAHRAWVTTATVMKEGLFIDTPHQDRRTQMRVADVLKAAGWVQRRLRVVGGKNPVRRWYPNEKAAAEGHFHE